MTEQEHNERIAAIRARRAARGINDPLNRLRAYTAAAIARGESPIVEVRA